MNIQSRISFFFTFHKLFKCSGVKCLHCGSKSPTFLLSDFEFYCSSLPEFRACLIPRESEQTKALSHGFLLKSIGVKPEGHERNWTNQYCKPEWKKKPTMWWCDTIMRCSVYSRSYFVINTCLVYCTSTAKWHPIKYTVMLVASLVLNANLSLLTRSNKR